MRHTLDNVNWTEVQKYHDECGRIIQTCEKFNISKELFHKAVDNELLKKNLKPYRLTDEQKKKISEERKKYYLEHKDLYQNSKKRNKSIPCEFLKKFLRRLKFDFEEEYSVFDRGFAIDIAFPKKMLAIEVNGTQHYVSYNSEELKPYYKKRDEYFKNLGWKTVQIFHNRVYNKTFRRQLIELINGERDILPDYPRVRTRKLKTKNTIKMEQLVADRRKLIEESGIDLCGENAFYEISKLFGNIKISSVQWYLKKYLTDIYDNCKKSTKKLSFPSPIYMESTKKSKNETIKNAPTIKNKPKLNKSNTTFKERIKKLTREQNETILIANRKNIVLTSVINFKQFGWVSKLAKLFKTNRQHVHLWMKEHMLDFYNNCYPNVSDRKLLIENSGIDFSKPSWQTEVSKLIGIDKRSAKDWIKYNMPELYAICYINHASVVGSSKCEIDRRMKIVNECGIDFSKRGWSKPLSKLFGISKTSTLNWLKKYMPDFYSTCFR